MTFSGGFGHVFRPVFDPGLAALPWYRAGGASLPVAAYQPKGAASLAASYTNLANPGTYDAAPGTAPSFNTATGWTFDRSLGQFLSIGSGFLLKPATVLVRMTPSGTSFRGVIGGSTNGCFAIIVWPVTTVIQSQYAADIYVSVGALTSDMVLGFTYSATGDYVYYINGAAIASGTQNINIPQKTNYIGKHPDGTFTGNMAGLAFWQTVRSAGEVAAVSAAMAAL